MLFKNSSWALPSVIDFLFLWAQWIPDGEGLGAGAKKRVGGAEAGVCFWGSCGPRIDGIFDPTYSAIVLTPDS